MKTLLLLLDARMLDSMAPSPWSICLDGTEFKLKLDLRANLK